MHKRGLIAALLGAWCLSQALVACDDGGEGDTEGDTDMQRFGCVFESKLIDSCNNPQGSPWTAGCVDVLTEADCMAATMESSEMVGDCTFTTTYQNVQTTPGVMCPEEEGTGTGPLPTEGAAVGEDCSTLTDCAQGLCIPTFYCTISCSVNEECHEEFPDGCCVSEGSLGYCIAQDDCAALCPANASPVGLPTVCECDEGFEWNADFTQCVAI